jgi:hypothetical protein
MQLSSVIFWDTNSSMIDWDKRAQFVIQRVVMYGTVQDWEAIKKYYGLNKIRELMLRERELDPKALSFLSCIFGIPKEQFRCSKEKQLTPAHLNFW